MIIFLPLAVALIGGVMWFAAKTPDYKWFGFMLCGVGLHAFLVAGGGQAIGLLGQ